MNTIFYDYMNTNLITLIVIS